MERAHVRVGVASLAHEEVDHVLEVVGGTERPEARSHALEGVSDLGALVQLQAQQALHRGVPLDVSLELLHVLRLQVLSIPDNSNQQSLGP
jgi:hypothetical protein